MLVKAWPVAVWRRTVGLSRGLKTAVGVTAAWEWSGASQTPIIKVFPPPQAFPLALIELQESLSSVTAPCATLPAAVYFKTPEFKIPTEIRAACSVLAHLNAACNYKSPTGVSPPVVGGGSTRSRRITGEGWHLKELMLFDPVIDVVVLSFPTMNVYRGERGAHPWWERLIYCVS